MRPNLDAVAAGAGDSKCTVSLALRDSHKVAPATRACVRAVARAMAYERDAVAALMARRRLCGRVETRRVRLGLLEGHPQPERSFFVSRG